MDNVIFIGIWILLLGFVAFLFIKRNIDKKKYKGMNMDIDDKWLENSLNMYIDDQTVKQYYFHHDSNFTASGHVMEDRNHKIVYEAKFLYNNVLGDDEVDFINHIIDYKSHHKLGHTVSHSVGSGNVSAMLSSTFKFDNVDVYDYLESLGYTFHFNYHGLAYTVDIYKDNKKVATLYSSNNGKNFFNSDGPIEPKIGGSGYMIIETTYQHLDCSFLYAIAISRTELSQETFKN